MKTQNNVDNDNRSDDSLLAVKTQEGFFAMNIVFPIFDQVTQLDFTGPVQVLSRIPDAQVFVVSHSLNPVATDSGFSIQPTTTYADCPKADLICVPGGLGTAAACQDERLLSFLRQQVVTAKWITSVCTGMFILGMVGVLKGKKVTSHWGYTALIEKFGAEHVESRYVVDGNLVTGGGVTAGIDFAFYLTSLIVGEEAAKLIQLSLEYNPELPFRSGHPSIASEVLVQQATARYEPFTRELASVIDSRE